MDKSGTTVYHVENMKKLSAKSEVSNVSVDVTRMSPEERRTWLKETRPHYDLEVLMRKHYFLSSRPYEDGTAPSAPDWNPGCSCGEGMYFFEHGGHVATVIINDGWENARYE